MIIKEYFNAKKFIFLLQDRTSTTIYSNKLYVLWFDSTRMNSTTVHGNKSDFGYQLEFMMTSSSVYESEAPSEWHIGMFFPWVWLFLGSQNPQVSANLFSEKKNYYRYDFIFLQRFKTKVRCAFPMVIPPEFRVEQFCIGKTHPTLFTLYQQEE